MVNSKKRIIVMLSFLALLFIFVIGISYAYYAANVIGNLSDDPSLKLTSGYLSMVYEGGDTSITGGSTEGTTNDLIYTKNFTVTNNGVADSNFGIWIKDYKVKDKNGIDATLTRPEDWTYVLSSADTIIKTGTFPTEDEALISAYPLSEGQTKNLTLTLTYNYITAEEGETDQTADMGKVLSFDIQVVQTLNNLESAKPGTLLYAINRDNIVSEPKSLPGQATSLDTEAVLASTLDDYGTSYYYRGNVKNNYVNFAGMCWRIVRIAGDGSTKIILEDQYTTCDDIEDTDGEGTTDYAYTGNWNIGIGNYGYETKDVNSEYIMNYLNPVTDVDKSMVKAFYDFQTTKLADYTGKLKSGDWCLGDKAYTRSGSSGSYTYTPLEEYNYSSIMYYDAYTRLTSGNANGYQPTLKCNGTILDKFATVSGVSNEAPMYVSAITTDEIVYAGCKYGEGNSNYYLINNYQMSNDKYFWSLSPDYFRGSHDFAFFVVYDGRLFNGAVDSNYAFRPSVSLVSSAVISSGEGTLEKPYKIG